MRRTIVKFHRWGALLLGGWLLLQAASGVMLVYKPQLMAALYPAPLATGGRPVLSELIGGVHGQYPAYRLTRLTYPAGAQGHYIAALQHRQRGETLKTVYDSHAGRFTTLAGLALLPDLLFDFHDHILLGGMGRNLVGLLGGFLIFWSLSGIYLWWPGRRKRPFTINMRGPRRLQLYDLHRVFGVTLSLFLIALAVTGMMMVYRSAVVALFDIETAAGGEIPPRLLSCRAATGLDDFMDCLKQQASTGRIKDIRFDKSGDAATVLIYASDVLRPLAVDMARITVKDPNIVAVDYAASESRGLTAMNWMYPAHTGHILGPGRILAMTLFGVGLMLIIIFGFWLWAEKRLNSKGKKHEHI